MTILIPVTIMIVVTYIILTTIDLTNIECTIVLMYGVYYTFLLTLKKFMNATPLAFKFCHFFTKKNTVLLVPLSYSGDVRLGETDPIFEGVCS